MKNFSFVRFFLSAYEKIKDKKEEPLFILDKIVRVSEDFQREKREKHHGIQQYFLWFLEKINLYHKLDNLHPLKKWGVYYVDFGINIGSEINGVRPAMIFQRFRETHGSDVVVIPISTKKESKKKDRFDILISPEKENGLQKISILKIRQIRCVSKKRIQKYIGSLSSQSLQEEVEKGFLQFFDIKNPA